MENLNIKKKRPSNGIWGGVIIILIGVVALLSNLNIDIPHWLISWSTFLMAFGLIIGFKHNFRGGGWLIMVIVGAMFTLDDIAEFNFNFSNLTWPILMIGLGLFLILRPKGAGRRRFGRKERLFGAMEGMETPVEERTGNHEDFLDSINVFGGSHQKVFSKNFQGGEIVAVFGGCDVDLSQAEFQSTVIVDITAIFGGCKIIVPPSWEVKSEITAIFGGVDDKRNIMPVTDGTGKRIVLKGIAMFGGVEIKNY